MAGYGNASEGNAEIAEGSRKMVGLGRLELPTSPLSGVRSNQLSYGPTNHLLFQYYGIGYYHNNLCRPDGRSRFKIIRR